MASLTVEIDPGSGFCFGVVKAVEMAESALAKKQTVYCLGEIVHNGEEVDRLEKLGMKTISHQDLEDSNDGIILFRAHGEPPTSYDIIKEKKHKLADATCPVVLKLQQRVKQAWLNQKNNNGQVVIYGKKGHAEVIGLLGQTNGEAILVEKEADLAQIDFTRPTEIFSQTTKSVRGFQNITDKIQAATTNGVEVIVHDTICRQVANRVIRIQEFARKHDIIIMVGGLKSSNAQMLFQACREVNSNSHFVTGPEGVQAEWFQKRPAKVGVCGGTSTPAWLMKQVAQEIEKM